jgi:hypothetical protein
MGILSNIAKRIKSHNCEEIINCEISAYGAAIKDGPGKINIGMFSNKIVELVKASETAVN